MKKLLFLCFVSCLMAIFLLLNVNVNTTDNKFTGIQVNNLEALAGGENIQSCYMIGTLYCPYSTQPVMAIGYNN